MSDINYLEDIIDEILEGICEIYSMGLISADNKELDKYSELCERCGFLFAAASIKNINTGLAQKMNKLEKNFFREAEELLLLANWLIITKKELELKKAEENLTCR